MTTLDPAISAWLDQDHRRTADLIRRFGVAITYVSPNNDCCEVCSAGLAGGDDGRADADGTAFAYTVGLFGIGHPELLVLGLEADSSMRVLNDIARRVRSGALLTVGEMLTVPGWTRRLLVEAVPNPGEIAFSANRFYERPDAFSVPLLQLTYDDENGLFPDQAGYSLPPTMQPRPGRFRA